MSDTAIHPFRLDVPQADIDDLRFRLGRVRFPAAAQRDDQGIAQDRVAALAEYWLEKFDWRAAEARINAFPQFTTTIDGQNVHFIHVRSERADAVPLLLAHGWPGSVVEFLDVIGPLTNPDEGPAFHLVIPSIPGFGPSGPITAPNWDPARIGAAFAELMARLGYTRYGVQGGDWGAGLVRLVAAHAPEAVIGIHMNYAPHPPAADTTGFSEDDVARNEHIRDFIANRPAYWRVHETRSQTIGYALADSPIAALAWYGEKLDAWADPSAPLTDEQILTDISLHWFCGTTATAPRIGAEAAAVPGPPPAVSAPIAVMVFPHDIVRPVRSVVAKLAPTLVRWTEAERGGHFAALEVPEIFAADVRAFFADLS
ncbi:microsomal epoxide hydrolase [Actinorhabdospora filicis]|uniref:Microsomal epoxide hydrolase n=1 Tax=Actinorhabdospora filicis TaxID=1785913 RepID=A0A9W6W4Q3_9ACTN|nr:epoxide hydrolase family protein [Actinorhabdospora filicis]GLZ79522.1 microsomal epoxide hydrolase [Actinorhabdospora filicis]